MMVSPSSNYQLLSCTLMPQILNLKFINSMRVIVCTYTYLSSLFFLIHSLLPLSLHCECVSDHLQYMYYYLSFTPLFHSSSFTLSLSLSLIPFYSLSLSSLWCCNTSVSLSSSWILSFSTFLCSSSPSNSLIVDEEEVADTIPSHFLSSSEKSLSPSKGTQERSHSMKGTTRTFFDMLS